MRHRKDHRRLGVNQSQRKALLRSLCISLATYGQIETTVARAKELRREFEKLITLGKKGDLAARRMAYSVIPSKSSVAKIFNEYAPAFESRTGGYTRIIRTGFRYGDNSKMALIKLVGQGVDFNTYQAPKEEDKKVKETKPKVKADNDADKQNKKSEKPAKSKGIFENIKRTILKDSAPKQKIRQTQKNK